MIENPGPKLSRLKSALLMWYTIIPKMRKGGVGRDSKKDINHVNKLFGEIVDLSRELELTKADKFRIMMELI